MNDKFQSLGSSPVLRQVFSLVLILVTLSLVSSGSMFWFKKHIAIIDDKQTHYHLMSISLSSSIKESLYKFLQSKPFLNQDGRVLKSTPSVLSDGNNLVYTIREKLDRIQESQNIFHSPDFVVVLEIMENRLTKLERLFDKNEIPAATLKNRISSLILEFDKFEKLHLIRSGELMEEARQLKDNYFPVVTLVIILLLLLGFGIVSRNIKEIKTDIQAREELIGKIRAFSEELDRSNQELKSFASIASHDLQEPLRKIILFSDLLKNKKDGFDRESREYIEIIQKASLRMRKFINDLLKYSKVSSLNKPFEPTDLEQIVKEVIVDLEARIFETQATINYNQLPTLEVDPFQIRQLFLNLIGNSLKYHREGVAPVVNLSCEEVSNGKFKILIEDNGIGFEEKYREKIFKPFQRLHGDNFYSGTGIGLAICEKIVSRHNGTLSAKSSLNKGSTFIITLPCKQAEVATLQPD